MGRRMVAKPRKSRVLMFMLMICIFIGVILIQFKILAKPAGLLGKLDVSYSISDLTSNKYRVSPAIAATDNGSEPFESIVDRLKPVTAICGTYYDENHRPLGDIVMSGKVVCRGSQRQGIGFTSNGKIKFLERHGRSRINWAGCVSGIACGPRLVRGGRKDINVKRDGFRAVAATNTAWRCAVGATKDGKLILCAISEQVTLSTLADVLLELGAVDAINLDGGSMCAFYTQGKFHVQPVRSMSNILAVYQVK